MENYLNPIEAACLKMGGQANLAKYLKLSPSVVHQWRKGLRPVSAIHCQAIEKVTGVSRRDLRPNDWQKFWPELIQGEANEQIG